MANRPVIIGLGADDLRLALAEERRVLLDLKIRLDLALLLLDKLARLLRAQAESNVPTRACAGSHI